MQTFFDYHKLPSELKEDLFEKAFQATKFDEILKFVHFTNVTVIRRQRPSSKNERPRGGLGRRDMEFFFNFLYKKGVRYILKVVVDEGDQSVHSDEAIKNALDRIVVEHLDWRKVDCKPQYLQKVLCSWLTLMAIVDPQLICGISSQAEDSTFVQTKTGDICRNQLRRLDLQWSGNSAVLRAWSEPEGLASLQNLETLNIVVPEGTVVSKEISFFGAISISSSIFFGDRFGDLLWSTGLQVQMYDSSEWISRKLKDFEDRLNKYCAPKQEEDSSTQASDQRKITIKLGGVNSATTKKAAQGTLQFGSTHGQTSHAVSQKVINTHEWLNCMDAFARNINLLWNSTRSIFPRSSGAAGLSVDQESRPALTTGLENDIVVALIDDGVSLLDQNFVGRVLDGKTFDYGESGIGQSYISARGHGTEMARCILRVCPMAKIYPSESSRRTLIASSKANANDAVRLKTLSHDGKNQIDVESAALVSA